MTLKIFLVSIATFFFTSISGAAVVKVACGSTSYSNVVAKIKDPFEKATGIKIQTLPADPMSGTTPDQIFGYLIKGEADITAFGSGWEDTLTLLGGMGITLSPKEYTSTNVGVDRLQIVTNKEVGLAKLTSDQVEKLFTGVAKNWKELGGVDAATLLVTSKKSQAGTTAMFEKRALKGKKINFESSVDAESAAAVIKKVSTTKGAFGFAPVSLVDSSVLVPEHDTIGRPIIMVTRGKQSNEVRKLLEFIKNEGAKNGVVH